MKQPLRLTDINTTQIAWVAMMSIGIASALDAITGPLWVHFGIHATVLESLSTALFWLSYGTLWLLLLVSAFRPETRFYAHGDCSLRAKRFALILSLLIVVHLWIAALAVFAFRGGWR